MSGVDATPLPSAAAMKGRSGQFLSSIWVWRLASVALAFAIWEIAGRSPISLALPPASDVVVAFVEMVWSGEMWAAYANSLPPLLTGLAIIIVGGVFIGVTVALARTAEWFLLPVLIIFQTAPVSAIIPLITYAYGIDDQAKVIAIVILGLPLVALNSYKGIQSTSPSLLAMSKSFLASRLNTILLVILPSASAMIFAGLRLGVSGAFIGIVLAELLITPTGIGDLITYNRSIARYDKMFAAIVSIIALAAVVLGLLQWVESRLFRTHQKDSA
ncbi:MAG: ABC transporter permease subunit [Pseudomonadota bacterium]